MASASDPLLGTDTRKVERPQNWKEAGESGWAPPVYDSDEQRRAIQKDFLTKVYGILAAQLLFTCGLCALFMLVEPVAYFVVGNIWFTLLLFVLTFASLIALYFLKNSYPWNFYLLWAFTLCMGSMVGTLCAVYNTNGMGATVAVAAGITMFVFVGLTIFVQLSDIDFSFLGLFLPVCLLVFIFWMIAALLLGFSLGLLFGGIGVLLFSGFIIYDTWMIMNRYAPLHAATTLCERVRAGVCASMHFALSRTCLQRLAGLPACPRLLRRW